MKSYIVKEREDGTRYFDENTPAGNINPDVVGNGLEYSEGKLSVDAAELAGDGLTEDNGKLKVDSASIENVVHLDGAESITGAKTFTTSPQVPTVGDSSDSTTKAASTAFVQGAISTNDANVVHKTFAEDINGVKTFVNQPVMSGGIKLNTTAGGAARDITGYSSDNKSIGVVRFETTSTTNIVRVGADTAERKHFIELIGNKADGGFATRLSIAPALTDNSVQIATTAWVKSVFSNKNGFKLNADGTISVDFQSMSQVDKDALFKELKLPIWLTASKNFYVNGTTGSDTLDEGRGETAAKPFKTIQACLNYVCDTYNLSTYNVFINISAGEYIEILTLPKYNTNTGQVYLRGAGVGQTILRGYHLTTGASNIINAYDRYQIQNLTLKLYGAVRSDRGVTRCIYVDSYATVNLSTVAFELQQDEQGAAMHCVAVTRYGVLGIGGGCSVKATMGDGVTTSSMTALMCYEDGSIQYNASSGTNFMTVEGSFNIFYVSRGGRFTCNVTYPTEFTRIGTVVGRRYQLTSAATVDTRNQAGQDYFPGTVDGTVETSTYCWYK